MYILNEGHHIVTDRVQHLKTIQAELEHGITSVTSKLNNLVTLGLARNLPISVLVLPHCFELFLPQTRLLSTKVNKEPPDLHTQHSL